ncbi:MAG TPA: hypothetical protein VGT02_02975 [Methylomirabilota bacterium]|nr:hypothetical protein [Methylomirabilota bacterium]
MAELRREGRMTWLELERGWIGAPEEILSALAQDGFAECKRALTTSRSDSRPAGGLWQGVDARTATVASAIWVNRPGWQQAIVFIDIDGQSFVDRGAAARPVDPYRDEGGEG